MKRIAILFLLLSLVAVGCRPKPKVVPPQTVPPVVSAPAPPVETPVAPPQSDFPEQPAQPDVLSGDIVEVDRVARERGWIRDAFFNFDASTLDSDAQSALQTSATWLRDHSEFRVRIEGHCDERGTEQYNLALGDRRAEAAASYLATLGVDRARIETVSYGEQRPFEEGSNEDAWAQNRRAHLTISGRR